jgi:hypothetical protein
MLFQESGHTEVVEGVTALKRCPCCEHGSGLSAAPRNLSGKCRFPARLHWPPDKQSYRFQRELIMMCGLGFLLSLRQHSLPKYALHFTGRPVPRAELMTLDEMNVECCYALQDKIWVTDPNGYRWEIFTVRVSDTQPALNMSVEADGAAQQSERCCRQ